MHMLQPPSASDRRARRRKIFYPTTMKQAGGQQGAEARIHLLDVSASGARGAGPVAPAIGSLQQVALGEGERTARVMWADRGRFGLSFTVPFTEAQIAALLTELGAGVER